MCQLVGGPDAQMKCDIRLGLPEIGEKRTILVDNYFTFDHQALQPSEGQTNLTLGVKP